MTVEETLLHDLTWRGLVHDTTQGLDLRKPTTVYLGVDPTATSLHVGSLLPIVCLNKFIEHGHKVIVLIGDGTAMIGDPSGKRNERPMLSNETIMDNAAGIKAQIQKLVPQATILHNSEWLRNVTVLGFLRTVGKNFSLGYMMGKDSVRSREEGISYTEFSYMLLQAYDFAYLNEHHQCTIQMGGSDQWGNITCGIDLIRKEGGGSAYGFTFPLLVGPNGEKFGKSANGAVWLDPTRTTPYHFHQFWLNVDDKVVIQYLKYFTTLSEEAIKNIEENLHEYASQRIAQKTLADAVTRLVHGEQDVIRVNQIREVLFGGHADLSALTEDEIRSIFSDIRLSHPAIMEEGMRLTELMGTLGICSRSAAKRSIEEGSIYKNGVRVTDPNAVVLPQDLLHGKYIVIRRGKKEHMLIAFDTISSEDAIPA